MWDHDKGYRTAQQYIHSVYMYMNEEVEGKNHLCLTIISRFSSLYMLPTWMWRGVVNVGS